MAEAVVYHNGQGLMTTKSVLTRLGLYEGQSINEGTMWKVITENAGELVDIIRGSGSDMNVDDLEAKVEMNRMASPNYRMPKHGLSEAVLGKIDTMLKLKTA